METFRHPGTGATPLVAICAAIAASCGGSQSSGPDSDGGLGNHDDGGLSFVTGGGGGEDGGGGSGDGAVLPQMMTILGPGVASADQARVDNATPVTAQAPHIDYPLSGAVMPRNVYPPNVMWTPQHTPQSSDIYRVQLDRGVRRVEGYFLNAAGFKDAWQIPATAWPIVGDVDFAEPIQLRVAVLSGGVLREGPPLVFRTVDAFLRGSVYYWSPPESRIKRVDVGTASVVDFLPNPGAACIGCHALSRDGSKLAAQLDDSNGNHDLSYDSYDLTSNLTANPAPTVLNTPAAYGDVSLGYNADATRLVVAGTGQNRSFYALRIINSTTGALLRTATTASGLDPEWSPDNTAVAYTSQGHNGDDLMIVPVAADSFGATTLIHSGSSGTDGTKDWHPSWSPNSQWLAFQNGVDSTAGSNNITVTFSAGAVWLVARTGGNAVRLDKLDGPAPAESYRPFFTPFDSGGYFWLLFTSGRSYGNAAAGVSGQEQAWVAAIADKPGSGDPSEVPYYLAGQETNAAIISPQWAPSPCRMNGDACTTDGDCCAGVCSGSTCKPPLQCVARGGACSTSTDCCAGLTCGGHICDTTTVY